MQPHTARRFPNSFVTLVVLILAAGCKFEKPIVVQTEKAARRNLTETVTATGKIQPVLQIKISPEVSGEIIELPVKEGQRVRKGDLLVKIRRDFYEASRRSADANRNSAEANHQSSRAQLLTSEANLRRAEAEFKRTAELFDKKLKLVSDSVFDEVRTAFETAQTQVKVSQAQCDAARHQVEMASAALRKADEDLLKTTIYSPIDGTVSKLNAEAGERVVGTGMMAGTEIMTIADLNDMEARVEVGEVDVIKVALGQRARLEVDSFRDRKFSGTVTQIANSARSSNLNTQMEATKFEVRIRISESEGFRPGMSVTADIETVYRTNVISVPIQSVTSRLPKKPKESFGAKLAAQKKEKEEQDAADQLGISDKRRKADVAKPTDVVFVPNGSLAKALPVKRGISDDNYYEIVSGLEEGAEVVSGGFKAIARDLEDGKKIKVDNAPKSKSSTTP